MASDSLFDYYPNGKAMQNSDRIKHNLQNTIQRVSKASEVATNILK